MKVFEEVKYSLEGYCCKCGDCCRFLYCVEPINEFWFKLMQVIYPKYRRFKIIGKDKNGIILACSLIKEDGLCPDYDNRPDLCRDYPNPKKIYAGGRLYKRCTYKLTPEKSFEEVLSNDL